MTDREIEQRLPSKGRRKLKRTIYILPSIFTVGNIFAGFLALIAILGAEYILRWLPIGTHDWEKFITPKELETIAKKNNFNIEGTIGTKFNPLLKKWHRSSDASVNYISTFIKD